MTAASGIQGDFGRRNASADFSTPDFSKPDFSALDFSALTAPVSRAEVHRYRITTKHRRWSLSPLPFAVIATMAAVFLFGAAAMFLRAATEVGDAFSATTVPLLLALVAGAVVVTVPTWLLPYRKWSRWTRLDRFARANGLTFLPWGVPAYPGAIFGLGQSRLATDHLVTATGRYLDLGNYRYSTGSGHEGTVHEWGFLALKLDRTLPHIVLDARANNGVFGASTLPVSFDRGQALSLEGDFDRYFTLYCPNGYERDALYVFTPDLLVLLIDESRHFDVEIVDDWMFVYSAARFDMTDPTTLRRLFRIVDTVGAKTLRQTARYSDVRAGRGLVAPAGRRLRSGTPVAVILLAAATVVIFGANAFGLLATLFG